MFKPKVAIFIFTAEAICPPAAMLQLLMCSALAAALAAAFWSQKQKHDRTMEVLQALQKTSGDMLQELQHATSVALQQLRAQKMMEMRLQWLESSLQDAPCPCKIVQWLALHVQFMCICSGIACEISVALAARQEM